MSDHHHLSDKVIIAKTVLMNVLGENSKYYLNCLKLWFRHKCTKEEFDVECRKLLKADKIHLHNKFLLALLNKIGTYHPVSAIVHPNIITTTSISCTINNNRINNNNSISNTTTITTTTSKTSNNKKRKRNSARHYFDRVNFDPPDMFQYFLTDDLKFIMAPNSSEDNVQPVPAQRYCAQELFLPDTGFIMGRLLVTAWECGLINVDDNVSEYICASVYTLLKNVLSSIVMKRKHYRVNTLGQYFYDIGQKIYVPFLQNTVRRKIDDGPLDLDKEITTAHLMRKQNDDVAFLSACQQLYAYRKTYVSVTDMYRAMRDRNMIASHSVYSLNLERLTQLLP